MTEEIKNNISQDIYHFCQWLDINNRSIYITVTKNRELISEMYEYSQSTKGKVYMYVFSIGICNDEFTTTFDGLLENFITKDVETHNYKVSEDIDAFDIIPKFEQLKEEMKEDNRSLIIKFEKTEESLKQDEIRI